MTIKYKISIYTSILFTVLYGVISLTVIFLYSNNRKEEFRDLLEEKALTSIKLLIEIQEIDKQLLQSIDRITINKLFNEKTLIFDSDFKLIYSSLDDTKITWSIADLEYLKKYETFFKQDGDYEVYGVFFDTNEDDYYALISASDEHGKSKLMYLTYVLVGAYILFTILAWILTFYLVKSQIKPLELFHKKIKEINEFNLESRLEINSNSQNEIDLIGNEFNFMMNRIQNAYQKQKEFTAHASHELRTPLARISVQIENQISRVDEQNQEFLFKILEDINELNSLIRSLLILSKIETSTKNIDEKARVDEAIYNCLENITASYPEFKISFDIENSENIENLLEVNCNQNLLEIAFYNLLKNAYLYSNDQKVFIKIKSLDDKLLVEFTNTGKLLSQEEQENLFTPFMRGENSNRVAGIGLGLRIVERILNTSGFNISYSTKNNQNNFILMF